MIAIDLGGTGLRVGRMGHDGILTAFEKHLQRVVLGDRPAENLVSFIAEYIARQGFDPQGVAIALPGTISMDGSTVLNLPNVPGLDGVNIKALLSDRFRVPVTIMKDVTALISCDMVRFALPSEGVTIAIYVGTGLGNAICIDGKIHRGQHGSAGELGHIPLLGLGGKCGCGNAGCAELLVGGKHLETLQNAHFSDTPIAEIFAHANHPLLCEYLEALAAVIAAEVNILDPGTVILGGGVVSMNGFPYQKLVQSVLKKTRKPYPEQGLRFYESRNDYGENGVIGAGIYALEVS